MLGFGKLAAKIFGSSNEKAIKAVSLEDPKIFVSILPKPNILFSKPFILFFFMPFNNRNIVNLTKFL